MNNLDFSDSKINTDNSSSLAHINDALELLNAEQKVNYSNENNYYNILNEQKNDTDINSFYPNTECTALVTLKERRLMSIQNAFKKSIRVSLKSFLISLSLSFLNLFI